MNLTWLGYRKQEKHSAAGNFHPCPATSLLENPAIKTENFAFEVLKG